MSNKIWRIGEPDEIIESIRVRDDENRMSIDVYSRDTFLLAVNGEEFMSFNKDEMKNIYEFLKRFYE